MTQQSKILRWLSTLEWQWSLWSLIKGSGVITSFALPAWAVNASHTFAEYAPLSWVVAGFLGLFVTALSCAIYASAADKLTRVQYNRKMLSRGNFVDPMEKAYQDIRIYLNDFCLPSFPLIENKTFINCEIIGPSNVVMEYGNNISEPRYPISDAVKMKPDHKFFNAVIVRNCTFRQCSFQRVTFLVPHLEYETAKHWSGFNWITHDPSEEAPPISGDSVDLLPPSTGA